MRPTAQSFLLDLLSTIRQGTMPVGALVEAAGLFGIPENNLRVALARLCTSGVVARDERGRYRLGPGASPVGRRLSTWRHPERSVRSWSGGWIGAHLDRSVSRSGRKKRESALRLFGLRALALDLAVRPDNLSVATADVREELRALGLPTTDRVFSLRDLDAETDDAARRLWDVRGIRDGHRQLAAKLDRSTRRLGRMTGAQAMVESFLLGGDVIRALVLDPLLPDEICPSAERNALVAAMRRYDELGRAAWADFLARFDVPHHRNPIHTRMVGDAAAIA